MATRNMKIDEHMGKRGFLPVVSIAKTYSVTTPSVYNWVHAGKVEAKRVGGVYYVSDESVREMLGDEYLEAIGIGGA